jgi:hypothetical protein
MTGNEACMESSRPRKKRDWRKPWLYDEEKRRYSNALDDGSPNIRSNGDDKRHHVREAPRIVLDTFFSSPELS